MERIILDTRIFNFISSITIIRGLSNVGSRPRLLSILNKASSKHVILGTCESLLKLGS